MQSFASAKDAKEFLISRIVAQAKREGTPLSEIERKMLYFSETGWTLPDIAEVNQAFDREYDQTEYEEKITKLIRSARANEQVASHDDADMWAEAVRILSQEDHYILVMTDPEGGPERPRGDLPRLVLVALAIVGILAAVAYFVAGR